MLTETQRKAIALIVSATMDAIRSAGPLGAPTGVLYAAMMAHGASKSQFDSLMDALVSAGRVRKDGDVYHAV